MSSSASLERRIVRSTTVTPQRMKKLASSELSMESDKGEVTYHYYECPVFATGARLLRGGVSEENKPLFYVKLRSLRKPYRWVKRSVALILEPSVNLNL